VHKFCERLNLCGFVIESIQGRRRSSRGLNVRVDVAVSRVGLRMAQDRAGFRSCGADREADIIQSSLTASRRKAPFDAYYRTSSRFRAVCSVGAKPLSVLRVKVCPHTRTQFRRY
jgi:hypothetical protein